MMPTPPDEESSWDSIQDELGLNGAQPASTPLPPPPAPAPAPRPVEEEVFASTFDDDDDDSEGAPDTLVDLDDGFGVDAVALDPDDAAEDDGPEMLDAPSEVIDVDGEDEPELAPSDPFTESLEGDVEDNGETVGATADGASAEGAGKKKRRRRRRRKKKNGAGGPTEGATADSAGAETDATADDSVGDDEDAEYEDAEDEAIQIDETLATATVSPLPDMKLVSWADLVAGLYRP